MTRLVARLQSYAGLTSRMLAWPLLGLVWGLIFRVFLEKMLPRLDYLGAGRGIARDSPCGSPECDFSAFWPAGVLARAHSFVQIYQPYVFLGIQRHLLVASMRQEAFFYPPFMVLPSALVSYLPFETAFFVWTAAGIFLSVLLLRWARLSWRVIAIGLLSPASLWNVELGQIGILCGALLVSGLVMTERAPWRAGAAIGLLAIKPQLGLLAPVVLLVRGNFRAFAGTVLCVCMLGLVTLAVFGVPLWRAYLLIGTQESKRVLEAPFAAYSYSGWGLSIFWMLRSLHSGLRLAYAGQAVATVFCIGLTVWIWREPGIARLYRAGMTSLLALLASPYGYSDDMVGYSLVLAWVAEDRNWRIGTTDAVCFLWPACSAIFAQKFGVLLTPFVVAFAAARLWLWSGMPLPHLPAEKPVLARTRKV